jgi:hypothetical protein
MNNFSSYYHHSDYFGLYKKKWIQETNITRNEIDEMVKRVDSLFDIETLIKKTDLNILAAPFKK